MLDREEDAAVLEFFRKRNAALDALFYDVAAISDAEAQSLAPWLAREGAILVVPPDSGAEISVHATLESFWARPGDPVRVMAVAGVGSSALGTAAFARNVANALGESVVGVVSGYGLSDLATEAVGGYFLFGQLNSLRHLFQLLETALPDDPNQFARASLDTRTVLALLDDPRSAFQTVIGHSKGNLVISEALFALDHLNHERARALGEATQFVTVSARIALPGVCRHVTDIMGALDWFGALNSRPDIATDYTVPNAWHHTNRELPLCLDVPQALQVVRERGLLRM
ncbi:MAG: hypothetical protein HC855_13005 [Rhizobiales bacterium]|nr:hypothetical protein [Hyphomicrobiales bacterium]